MKLIFKNIFKSNNTIYFLTGCVALLFKYVSKWELSALILFILIVINLLKKLLKLSAHSQFLLKHLNWIFIPLFIYSFFFEPKVIGLLMIAHFFSDTIARIIRIKVRGFHTKYFLKSINGSLFFALSFYILSLLYVFFFDGFILKRYVLVFFINSLVLSFLENSFKIRNYPDNFNINVFGSLFIFLSLYIDFRLRISSINMIFGLLWCLLPIIFLILFDIINLKVSYKYYLFFILLYTGFGYKLFLFNIFILAGMGLVKKMNQFYSPAFRYYRSFIEINEIREYFLLSFILVFMYFFIPHLRILKMSLVVGLITAFLHYFYHSLDSYISKKYFNFKSYRISQEILLFNIVISLLFLFAGYLLNVMKFIPMIYAFSIINIYMLLYISLRSVNFNIGDKKLIKFLIPYFSFKLFFLFQSL